MHVGKEITLQTLTNVKGVLQVKNQKIKVEKRLRKSINRLVKVEVRASMYML